MRNPAHFVSASYRPPCSLLLFPWGHTASLAVAAGRATNEGAFPPVAVCGVRPRLSNNGRQTRTIHPELTQYSIRQSVRSSSITATQRSPLLSLRFLKVQLQKTPTLRCCCCQ